MIEIAGGIVLGVVLLMTMRYWLPVLGFLIGLAALFLLLVVLTA